MKISQSIKDSFSPREKVMYHALEIVGKMLRQNPMGDLDLYPMKILTEVMPGGIERDPDGEEYISYFLTKSVSELREKGII